MKFAMVVSCLVLVACGEKYQYVQRDGATLRIDDKGHVAVLRVQSGTSEWVAIKTADEVAADAASERTRCAERIVPVAEGLKITPEPNGLLSVYNGTDWKIRELRFDDGSVARIYDDSSSEAHSSFYATPTHAGPGTVVPFAFASDTHGLTASMMVGVPATCPTL